jgi:hypothetical protein
MRAIHAELMAEFGGPGARGEEDLLATTFARPRQPQLYEDARTDLAAAAAGELDEASLAEWVQIGRHGHPC